MWIENGNYFKKINWLSFGHVHRTRFKYLLISSMIVRGIEMKCEICDGTFEIIQQRIDDMGEKAPFIGFCRVVEYRKCKVCLSGMVLYHPAFPK